MSTHCIVALIDALLKHFTINNTTNDHPLQISQVSNTLLAIDAHRKVVSFGLSLNNINILDPDYWINTLKIGDKIDYQERKRTRSYWNIYKWSTWRIASIVAVHSDKIQFLPDCNQFFNDNNQGWYYTKDKSKNVDIKISLLNTETMCHTYLNNASFPPCCGTESWSWRLHRYVQTSSAKCKKCFKLCCTICAMIPLDNSYALDDTSLYEYECTECNKTEQYNKLLNAILLAFDSNYGYLLFDRFIINIIVEFGIGFIIKCSNYSQCGNDISFRNEIEMNFKMDSDGNRVELITKQTISDIKQGNKMKAFFGDNSDSDDESDDNNQNSPYYIDYKKEHIYNKFTKVLCRVCCKVCCKV